LQQKDERTRAAVHDRDFRARDVDVDVVDPESGERRHHVLDRGDRRAIVGERRREPRVAMQRIGGDRDRPIEVYPMESVPALGAAERSTARRAPVCSPTPVVLIVFFSVRLDLREPPSKYAPVQ
jgi:hypothetical protein